MNHADLHIENTGTGAAYDIQVAFEPPPLATAEEVGVLMPIEKIGVLKPGQRLGSYLCEFAPLLGMSFVVTISWIRDPKSDARENLTYVLNMQDVARVSQLGPADPSIELAEQVKKIREDWHRVASGLNHIKTDIFTSDDRRRDQEQLRERMQQRRDRPPSS